MKKYICLMAFAASLFCSCRREGVYTQQALVDLNDENSVVLREGVLVPTSGIVVEGSAAIRQNGDVFYVELKNFAISDGPDLKVYLSESATPTSFVNLGSLQESGGFYIIPQGVVNTDYAYVLIHCQQYNHLFATANLD